MQLPKASNNGTLPLARSAETVFRRHEQESRPFEPLQGRVGNYRGLTRDRSSQLVGILRRVLLLKLRILGLACENRTGQLRQ